MNEPYITNQSKISDHLRDAENKLQAAGFVVVRHVRLFGECFGLQTYGNDFYDLEKVRNIVGSGYRLTLNTNLQQILIK